VMRNLSFDHRSNMNERGLKSEDHEVEDQTTLLDFSYHPPGIDVSALTSIDPPDESWKMIMRT